MNLFSGKNLTASALCLITTANLAFVQSASAQSVTCRDYYSAYVSEATIPSPTVVVVSHPHFHGHYAEYHEYHGHGGYDHGHHGGGNSDDDDAATAIALIAAGLITTSIVEDAKLNDAQQVINIVDGAQMGDGVALRNFMTKVQSNMTASVSQAQVSSAVLNANRSLEFCQAGDLDSVDELAARVARDLSASN